MEHDWSKEVATVTLSDTAMFSMSVDCLICGEPVAIDSYCDVPKICDKKCRFFDQYEEAPDSVDMTKLWLEEEFFEEN